VEIGTGFSLGVLEGGIYLGHLTAADEEAMVGERAEAFLNALLGVQVTEEEIEADEQDEAEK
jgi:hypothetical protein